MMDAGARWMLRQQVTVGAFGRHCVSSSVGWGVVGSGAQLTSMILFFRGRGFSVGAGGGVEVSVGCGFFLQSDRQGDRSR